ncbi:nucleotide-binding protein [Paenibacillus anseongense]|uniref:nucleotide-binding protein n=1 Tax=Paenibacillus anseongense TaxID=2682845 RepID=UPI002DB561C2|nr:nucleotide-binding protein [Paenibacillus anseongense]MEC0266714.1 nucleotide-binding protein [Paenibacillus anseongense]
MVKKATSSKASEPINKKPASLLMPKAEAWERIKRQIERGNELKDRALTSDQALQMARDEKAKWKSFTGELLARMFDSDAIVNEFQSADKRPATIMVLGSVTPFYELVDNYKRDMQKCINSLDSISDRLELIDELNPEPSSTTVAPKVPVLQDPEALKKVFIVHGHDNEAKQTAARFVEKFGLKAIIFHEQDDMGNTIVEKLERVSEVGYAIVLLTPDDIGRAKASKPEEEKHRARQNVIFEWGYFVAKLGRKNVFALLKGDVELLSDMQGVLWNKMDGEEAWKFKLARELKAAGFTIDMNEL